MPTAYIHVFPATMAEEEEAKCLKKYTLSALHNAEMRPVNCFQRASYEGRSVSVIQYNFLFGSLKRRQLQVLVKTSFLITNSAFHTKDVV